MDSEDLRAYLKAAIEPEEDEDGRREVTPHRRLTDVFGLDFGYWAPHQFGSLSPWSLVVDSAEDPINDLMPSLTASSELFYAGLRLVGDSIAHYHDRIDSPYNEGWGPLHFYPPALFAFCAAFEAEVRLQSHILLQVTSGLPDAVRTALLEAEEVLADNLEVATRVRRRPVLERYRIVLRFGHGYKVDRGSRFWQEGQAALRARDDFIHYDVESAPSITVDRLLDRLEAILLLFLWPSSELKRTVYSPQFELHDMLVKLRHLAAPFEERPLFKGSPTFLGPYLFPCSFSTVDADRYPSAAAQR